MKHKDSTHLFVTSSNQYSVAYIINLHYSLQKTCKTLAKIVNNSLPSCDRKSNTPLWNRTLIIYTMRIL